jgi:hypothetical protein
MSLRSAFHREIFIYSRMFTRLPRGIFARKSGIAPYDTLEFFLYSALEGDHSRRHFQPRVVTLILAVPASLFEPRAEHSSETSSRCFRNGR